MKFRVGACVLHSCVRMMKMGWILLEKGHNVHLVCERPLAVHGYVDFDSTNLIYTGHLDGKEPFLHQFFSTMKSLSPILDVIHFANEPDWPIGLLREACPDKPIIYDIHDMVSQRSGKIDDFEKEACEKADGFVVPSATYKEIIQQRYPFKPCMEVQSAVPFKLFPNQRRTPTRKGIVYEGGLKGKKDGFSDQFEFRSWADVFYKLSKLNVETWVYPSVTSEDFSEYGRSGCILMDPLPYGELLKNLTSHEAGLVGSPFPSGAFDGALPNKMFEYLAAGIPCIAYNAPTAKLWLEAFGFGKGVSDLKEIPDVLEQFRKEQTADHVWEMRKYHCMERQITKLETLYEKVINAKYATTIGGGVLAMESF